MFNFVYTMNKQKIVIPSGIGLSDVLGVGQLSWWVELWSHGWLATVVATC